MQWLLTIGLTNAAVATLLALAAVLTGRWWQRPALSHLLWLLVLVKLVTPPLVEVPVGWKLDLSQWAAEAEPAAVVAALPPAAPATATNVAVVCEPQGAPQISASVPIAVRPTAAEACEAPISNSAAPAVTTRAVASFAPVQLIAAIASLWLTGSIVWLGILLVRVWRFQLFVSRAGREEESLTTSVARLARRAGLRCAPRIVVVDQVVSPLLWGLGRRAVIVFPARLVESLSESARDSLLLHEVGHYARGDHWVRVLEMATQVLYWWHPLVWFAQRQIEVAEEQCCDAWVVERSTARRSYAEALLATIDFLSEESAPLPPVACGLGDVPLLRQRLTQIMRGETAARLSPALRVASLLAALVVLPLGPGLFASSRPEKERPAPMRIAVRETAPASALDVLPPVIDEVPQSKVEETPPIVPSDVAPIVTRRGALWASAVSPDGRFRIDARTGRQAMLLNVATGWRLDLSAHEIACINFARDAQSFATGHADGVVRIWDTSTGGRLASLKGSAAAITSVHYSPSGKQLAAGAADGNVLVWNALADDSEPALQQSLGTHIGCVRWSTAGDSLAVSTGAWNSSDAALVVWLPEENTIAMEEPLAQPAGALAWLDEGKTLAAAGWDGQTQLWKVATKTPVNALRLTKDAVSAAAWSADCLLITDRSLEVSTGE
jgi:beta-lactamase regulating signal transducer with metallopeptidase domain